MDFIDLHCDTATEAMHRSVHLTEPHLHIHLPVTKEIERHCQCFAIYCPDTVRGEHASVRDMARHIERMLELGGENAIAMGSDFDGCDVMDGIKGIDDIPALYNALRAEGISESVLKKIFWQNARDFFGRMI